MLIDLAHNFEIKKCVRKLLLLLRIKLWFYDRAWFCITSIHTRINYQTLRRDPFSIHQEANQGSKLRREGRDIDFRGWLCISWGGHWSGTSEQGNLGPLKGQQAFGMRDYARDDRAKHRKLPAVSASVWTPANFLVNRSTFVKIGGNYTNPASWRCGRAWVFVRVMNEVGELGR